MCPEMCKFCNKIALARVSGSFPKLMFLFLCFDFDFEPVSVEPIKRLEIHYPQSRFY